MSDLDLTPADAAHATRPPASSPVAWSAVLHRRVAFGVILAVLLLIGWLLFAPEGGSTRDLAPGQRRVADETGPSLDAVQWGYIELAVAAEAPALAPVPTPARVTFDERRTAAVGVPLAGRVEQVLVRPGQRVRTGEKLFSVRSGALADLDREFETARNEVGVKRRLAERTRELAALKAVPESEHLAAEAELREADLAFKAAASKRQCLKVEIDGDNLFWVTAPQNGTIVEQDVFASQEVTPDRESALLRIADLAEVLVLGDFQERDVYDVEVGAPVTIELNDDETQPGTVEDISQLVDPERRTVAVRIRAANADGLLRPNALVQVALQPDATLRRVRVPVDAVVQDGRRSVVFVARDKGGLEQVRVEPGRQRDGQLELRSGLDPGSRYVAKGARLLLNQVGVSL